MAPESFVHGDLHERLFEFTPEGILIVSEDLTIEQANAAAAESLGYDRGELLGLPLSAIIPTALQADHNHLAKRFLADDSITESHHMSLKRTVAALRKDGSEWPVNVTLRRMPCSGGVKVLVAVSDQTEIEQKNAQLMELSQKLIEEKNRAERDSQAKSRFLATISHELRTPLNAIIGFSEALQHGIYGVFADPRQQESVRTIHAQANHLLAMLERVMQIADDGLSAEFEQDCARIPVSDFIEDVVHVWCKKAKEKRVTITINKTDVPAFVYTDPTAIRQIADNLISNAIKYSPEEANVVVSGERKDGGLYVRVCDTGQGMSKGELAKAKEAFWRSRRADNSAIEGVGLGLTIASQLATTLGGWLEIDSSLGEGTTVAFWLPECGD